MPVCGEATVTVVPHGAARAPSFEELLRRYAKRYGPLALLALLAYYAFGKR